ncbi:hypothetical protein ASD39_06605 [Sphingomonas sp. Root50]|nr:hypothetical protein ASD17_04085 [Sphingomonas sp. Root1294]KQY68334.1 hypothetical protein ASD39_06605 [Sphingomonas sp. Root50]KRB91235.1 hypothetical protein ASE22_13410 [Sphingomonas sp. Root720]
MSLIQKLLSASALTCLVVAAGPALAAAPSAAAQVPDQLEGGEIVVTAEKRSGSASRIGLSITALSGEAIEAARISDTPRGHINSLSQEIRLSKSTPDLSWTVGGYASRDDIFEGQVAWLDNFSTVQLIRFVGGTVLVAALLSRPLRREDG